MTETALRHSSLAEVLAEAASLLDGRPGVDDARAEARELALSLFDKPASWLALHRGQPLDDADAQQLLRAAKRRAAGMPMQYATGRAHFRHLTLHVDERVLIPRPETEVLVDRALAAAAGGLAIDVGTGSGCIALALASEGRFERVVATDASRDALDVAATNVAALGERLRCPVELRCGSLLAPVRGLRARLVVSNPPYIATGEAAALPALVRDWEPALALYSGEGGMAHIAVLVRDATAVLEPGGCLLMEVDSRRASLAAELVAADGRYEGVDVGRDLTGRDRFVQGRRRETGTLNDSPPRRAERGTR